MSNLINNINNITVGAPTLYVPTVSSISGSVEGPDQFTTEPTSSTAGSSATIHLPEELLDSHAANNTRSTPPALTLVEPAGLANFHAEMATVHLEGMLGYLVRYQHLGEGGVDSHL